MANNGVFSLKGENMGVTAQKPGCLKMGVGKGWFGGK